MKLTDFFTQVERLRNTIPPWQWDSIEVSIPAHPGYPSFPGTPAVPLKYISRGFDWDHAKIFLEADAALKFNGKAYQKRQNKKPTT